MKWMAQARARACKSTVIPQRALKTPDCGFSHEIGPTDATLATAKSYALALKGQPNEHHPPSPAPSAVHEKVLQQQISDLNAMINAEDVFGLMFRLRCSLSRNQHGMLHEGLFSRAHAGTKVSLEGGSDAGKQIVNSITAAG